MDLNFETGTFILKSHDVELLGEPELPPVIEFGDSEMLGKRIDESLSRIDDIDVSEFPQGSRRAQILAAKEFKKSLLLVMREKVSKAAGHILVSEIEDFLK